MLENRTWQPIPGAKSAEIYPYIRKPDVLSSNSYLIRTAEQIVLIDPGALEEQADDLSRITALCLADHHRPVIIYLTHCHIDHSRQVLLYRKLLGTSSVTVAVCEEGGAPLTSGDSKLTLSELYGVPFPFFKPDILLLTTRDRETMTPRDLHFPSGMTLQCRTENINPPDGRKLFRQTIPLGGEDHLYLFHTPGHGPDGICLQIGHILFLGDLLAATNPMVAGITGWHQGDFIHTMDNMISLLVETDIRLCCPGHGGMLPASQTLEAFRRLRTDASRLDDLTEMNAEQLRFNTKYALDLIEEAEEIFTAIAGRLFYVSYWMEELGEDEAAAQYRNLIEADRIDACLADFQNLAEELHQGKKMEVEFAHRALGLIQKLKHLFNRGALENLLQQSLLNRATRLMMDFINVTRGVRNTEEFILVDLNGLIIEIIDEILKNPHADDTIIDLADDREAYLAALAARIAHVPLFTEIIVDFNRRADLPLVQLNAARFCDTLTDFLEQLAVGEVRSISISTGMDNKGVFLRVIVEAKAGTMPLPEAKYRLYKRRFGMCRLGFRRRACSFTLRVPRDDVF